jgi:hypothetical protein
MTEHIYHNLDAGLRLARRFQSFKSLDRFATSKTLNLCENNERAERSILLVPFGSVSNERRGTRAIARQINEISGRSSAVTGITALR